jgi:glycosyltransferase involved in cell wall biosynthesis
MDIVVNPVLYGAGLKIKTVEAFGYGLPLVTTEEGARGLPPEGRDACLIAANEDDFAACIATLASDLEMRRILGRAGSSFACSRLTPEACFRPLIDVLRASPGRT